MLCTPLRPGHLSVCVGDSSQCSEETVKNLKLHLSMQLLLLLSSLLFYRGWSQPYRMEQRPLPFSTPLSFIRSVLWCSGLSLLRRHLSTSALPDRLVGLVVKASASGAEDPGFKSSLRRDFSMSSHTSDLKIGIPVATLPGVWHYSVSAGTGRPGVSILWLGEVESLICNFYLSVAAWQIVGTDSSLRYTSMLLGR